MVVLGETAGRIKGSGVPIRQPLGVVYSEIRDGRIGETRNFLTWARPSKPPACGIRSFARRT